MELTVRETWPDDIDGMFSVRSRTRQNPASKELLAELGITPESTAADMESGRLRGWGCFHGDVLVGFCNGDGATGEVLVLAVLPEYEGKGIGFRLLAWVVEWLRSLGFEQPWLAASPDPGIRAHGFYRALGWKPTGQTHENGDEILEFAPGESREIRGQTP